MIEVRLVLKRFNGTYIDVTRVLHLTGSAGKDSEEPVVQAAGRRTVFTAAEDALFADWWIFLTYVGQVSYMLTQTTASYRQKTVKYR